MYARFRRLAVREGRHFLASDTTTTFLARNRVSSDETDVLVLVMLRNARRIAQYPDGRRIENITPHDWLENIKGHYLMQVFVDEATDLSTVQLACMIELANPRLRFWFACGDLRPRITANGMQDRSELEWLNNTARCGSGLGHFMFVYIHPDRMRVASVRPRVRAFANGCKEAGAVAPPWSFGFHTFRRAFEMTQDRLEAQGIRRAVL